MYRRIDICDTEEILSRAGFSAMRNACGPLALAFYHPRKSTN